MPSRSDTDGGSGGPVRTCAACGRKAMKAELLRFYLDGEGVVRPDPLVRAAGRGVYCCRHGECVRKAARNPRRLARAFRRPVRDVEMG